MAAEDEKTVAVVNDSISSSQLGEFAKRFPTRLFNVGIAEQNLVGFAAGLAASGLAPWVCSATCFLSFRALEQIKNDIVYSGHNVKLVGNTSGLDYGALGATHHALEDLGVLRALPGLRVIIPADHEETAQAVRALSTSEGPAYLRLYRTEVPRSLNMPGTFEVGKARVLKDGTDCVIFTCGALVERALIAANDLEKEGAAVGVVNLSTVSPLDIEGVMVSATKPFFA